MSGEGEGPAPDGERAQLRREREHLRRLRINEAGVALAALLVSVTVIGVNAYNHRRGSQIVVLQPEQVVLYRTTGGSDSNLWLAVQTQMVNTAREYGDVVVRASAVVHREDLPEGRFAYSNVVEPIMSPQVDKALQNCPQGARCLPATGFYVIERPKRLLDIPGGSSRTEYLAFQLESFNCKPTGAYCSNFANYAGAMKALRRGGSLEVSVDLQLQFDGTKTLRCVLPDDPGRRTVILDYLDEKGWAQPECVEPETDGEDET